VPGDCFTLWHSILSAHAGAKPFSADRAANKGALRSNAVAVRNIIATAVSIRSARHIQYLRAFGRTQGPDIGKQEMKVFGFAGWSGSGKTSLIEMLIPRLRAQSLTVSLIKHAHHDFDIDQPGKDSHRHRQAGCQEVLITSALRWALMHELRGGPELAFDDAVRQLTPCDIVLVEGFKAAPIPKLEVFRRANEKTWLHPADPHIVAIAADVASTSALPWFDLNDISGIASFIRAYSGL
jgi:molybdopterin-guanine dinucleotide biosynthesis adapter protein